MLWRQLAGGRRAVRRIVLPLLFVLHVLPLAARGQYVLQDAFDKHRYDPGFLVLPYALYTPTQRFGGGFVWQSTGLLQPQTDSFVLGFADVNNTYGFQGGTDDFQFRPIDRLFASTQFGVFRYNFDKLFINGPIAFPHESAGTNDSTDDNFISRRYSNDWANVEFKYLLPIGGGKDTVVNRYLLENGMVQGGQTGGHGWNPFTTGRTYLTVTPFLDYFTVNRHRDQHFNESGMRFGLLYDNTDFPLNPSSGNLTRFVLSRDFGLLDSDSPWTNVSAEYAQYFDLGRSKLFRQQVIAMDFWTSYSLTWSQVNVGGRRVVFNGPPFYDGATLGGTTRFRGYPDNRFWDRAAIYMDAELRLTPVWNPLGQIGILKKADFTWMQFVFFGEIGRVGPEYSGNLLSHLKGDAGFGVRLLANDTVIRFDVAASNEQFGIWAGLSQPF